MAEHVPLHSPVHVEEHPLPHDPEQEEEHPLPQDPEHDEEQPLPQEPEQEVEQSEQLDELDDPEQVPLQELTQPEEHESQEVVVDEDSHDSWQLNEQMLEHSEHPPSSGVQLVIIDGNAIDTRMGSAVCAPFLKNSRLLSNSSSEIFLFAISLYQ